MQKLFQTVFLRAGTILLFEDPVKSPLAFESRIHPDSGEIVVGRTGQILSVIQTDII